jgi:hypothetical protein
MNANCPRCGAVYTVSPQHVGRQVTCRKCSSALIIAQDGLHLADVPEAALVEEDEAEEEMPAPQGRKRPSAQAAWGGLASFLGPGVDIPTILFGAGAFFVILFLFLPLIDQAKVNRRQAAIDENNHREQRRLREFNDKKANKEKVDEELRNKQHEAFEKDKKTLTDDLDDAKVSQLRAPYWYRWGMMVGFWLLAAASLGYLGPNQPTIRRVTGCIVIVAEVVLIFVVFVGKSGISN